MGTLKKKKRGITYCAVFCLFFILSCSEKTDSPDKGNRAGPGTQGFLLSTDNKIYRFNSSGMEQTPIWDAEESGIEGYISFYSIQQFEGIFYFIGSHIEELKFLKYKNGEFHLTTITYLGSSSLISAAFLSENEYLLLLYNIDSSGEGFEESYAWVPDLSIDGVGLFSGFDGGVYPYDMDTIYSYEGTGGVKPITLIPSGTLRLAAPLGDGFIAATQDTIFYWDQAQWSELASGTVDEISTDPEGDVLFYNEYHSEYRILKDGELVPYDVFDTTTCPFSASALIAGSKRAFVCKEKPADLSCTETYKTGNYLIIEENGVLTCRDTPSESNPGMLFIMW